MRASRGILRRHVGCEQAASADQPSSFIHHPELFKDLDIGLQGLGFKVRDLGRERQGDTPFIVLLS